MAGWDTKPVNTGYTVVVGTTTGNYNNGNPNTYVKTWMEYLILQDSTDILNNRSRIDVKLYSQVISGGSGTSMANTYTANNYGYAGFDDGNKQYLSTTYNFNNFALNKFADATLTIPHNADGTKTINLQAAFTTLEGTWSITGGSVSASITLPTIIRGTTLTNITNRYYGYPATFELNRRSGSLWEQVWVECGVYSYHVVNNQANPNFTLTIPRDCTPNTAKPSSSSWTITIYTYSGSTLIDTASYSGWTWEINPSDTSYLPTLSATPTFAPYNDVVSQFGTYVAVAGYSKLRLSATKAQISTKYGAEVSIVSRSVTFSGGGGTVSDVNASTYTSNKYTAAGNITCTYTFTDSRGFSNSWTSLPISVKSYSAPTLSVSECYRGDSAHNESDSGTYAWGQASCGICTLAGSDNINRNSVTSFKAQVTGFSEVNLTNNTLAQLASGLSLSSVYTVTFSVTDITGHTATETRQIPSEDVPINIREGGKGIGIGMYAISAQNHAVIGYRTLMNEFGFVNWGNKKNYQVQAIPCTYTPSALVTKVTFNDFVNDLRSSPASKNGSVYLYTLSSPISIAEGWYHFEYIPHRCGYVFNASEEDNTLRAIIRLYALYPITNKDTYEIRITTTNNSTWFIDTAYRSIDAVGEYSPDPSVYEFTQVNTRVYRGQADIYGRLKLKQAVSSFYTIHPDAPKAVGSGQSFTMTRTNDGNIYAEDGVININESGQLRLIGRSLGAVQPNDWVFEIHYQINPNDNRYVYSI